MNKIFVPNNYRPPLDEYNTQKAIAYIKQNFQQEFSEALNLKRVSAPLFVKNTRFIPDAFLSFAAAIMAGSL